MKHKKIKKIISFLLALALLVSLPLDIQANAVALEGWILYAVITYLAAMGITFTVAGGVDAMDQAVKKKVKEYETQNNIIDFYDHFRNNNVRLVPGGGSDPDGNPFFDLFFTASAVDAIDGFISWLTTEGGWNLGGSYEHAINKSYSFGDFYEGGVITEDDWLIDLTTVSDTGSSDKWLQYSTLGEVFSASQINIILNGTAVSDGLVFTNSNGKRNGFYVSDTSASHTAYLSFKFYNGTSLTSYTSYSSYLNQKNYTLGDILGYTFIPFSPYTVRLCAVFPNSDLLVFTDYSASTNVHEWSAEAFVNVPTEVPEIKPLPNEGVSIKEAIDVPMTDPSLDDWAQLVRNTFEDIGTIPQPVPQVVPDPDYIPTVTPVPSPDPSPEIEDIEDLGLPALGEAIKNKFPFCLPSDLRNLVSLLVADPVTPKWEVDLYEWFDGALAGDTTLRIDLAEYEVLGQISRWASVISFSIFLLLITKGMIGW